MKKIARGILILATAALSAALLFSAAAAALAALSCAAVATLLLVLAFPGETRNFCHALRETIDGWVGRAEASATLVASALSSFRERDGAAKEPGREVESGKNGANAGTKREEGNSSHVTPES